MIAKKTHKAIIFHYEHHAEFLKRLFKQKKKFTEFSADPNSRSVNKEYENIFFHIHTKSEAGPSYALFTER